MNALLHTIKQMLGRYPDLTSMLNLILALEIRLMSKIDELKADVADYHDKVVAKVDSLKAEIAALQGRPNGTSDEELQGVINSIDAFKGELAPPVAPAPVEPAPAPVVEEPAPAPVEAAPAPEAPAA